MFEYGMWTALFSGYSKLYESLNPQSRLNKVYSTTVLATHCTRFQNLIPNFNIHSL